MRRAARLAVLYALEALAALLALAIFVGAAALWRLAAGPVQADLLRPAVVEALNEAFDGDVAAVGELTLGFEPARAAMIVTAHDVTVAEAGGGVLAQARRIEAGFALDALLAGRALPVSVRAEGGAFAVVRRADGSISAGLGRPQRLLRPAGSGAPEPSGLEGPALESLRAAVRQARDQGRLSRLSLVDLRGVQIRVVDRVDDLSLIFDEARALLRLEGEAVTADFSGALITSAGFAPVAARIETGAELEALFVDVRVSDLVPAAASPRRGPFAALGRVDAPVDLELVVDASRAEGLRAALLQLDAGEGVIRFRGEARALRSARVDIAFDTREGEVRADRLAVDSDLLALDLQGRLFSFSRFDNALPGRARFEAELGPGRLDLGGVFPEPIAWEGASAEGVLAPFDPALEFEQLAVRLERVSGDFAGRVALARAGGRLWPEVRLSGPVAGEALKADVLGLWPVDFALGARDWVEASVLGGRLVDMALDIDITAPMLAEGVLPDEALSLRFGFRDADVAYVSTMTPLRGLDGEAELRGNSLSLSGDGATIGALTLDDVFVEIPRLNPKGAIARFGGVGRGQADDLLRLLDEEPLGFATLFGVDPSSFGGVGAVEFEIGRPMRRFVPADALDFAFEGRFSEVSGPTGLPGVGLSDGVLTLSADPDGLTAQGEATVVGARADIRWRETFGLGPDAESTEIAVSARADGRALDALGLPLRRFLDGPFTLDATASGRGFDFRRMEVGLDLAEAAIAAPGEVWRKPPGEAARAALSLRLEPGGGVTVERATAEAPGAALAASARLDAEGRLLSAAAERVYVADLMELAAEADRPDGPDGPLVLSLSGEFLDAREILDNARRMSFGEGAGAPVSIDARLDRVRLRGGALSDVGFQLRSTERGVERLDLAATGPSGPVSVRFAPVDEAEGAARRLSVRAADAGLLLAALTGYDNAEGGDLRLDAEAGAPGTDAGVVGRVEVEAFRLERMPLLARVLAAGSFEGLAGLLSGGAGIDFERLEADFRWSDGILEMRQARAAGPSLGATWTGLVDFPEARLDVDGTLLPSYGVNSVLGELPLVGGLFTSRRGEGVIGVTFSAEGPFSAARVFANPLSALAPGVFRRIFEGTSAERELDALEAERRARDAENGG